MLSKKQEKLVRSLQQKKQRIQEKLFVVEGEKLIREAEQEGLEFHSFFISDSYKGDQSFKNSFELISDRDMKKISGLTKPPGLLALLPFYKLESKSSDLILVLDELRDPGNLGTIIRTAEAFGIGEIICSENTVDHFNPKVVQASMGSIFRMPLKYTSLDEFLAKIQSNMTCYGASLAGENLYQTKLKRPAALLMGSESHGISETLSKYIDKNICIPQHGKVESMNVSIATAVLLSEFSRQA